MDALEEVVTCVLVGALIGMATGVAVRTRGCVFGARAASPAKRFAFEYCEKNGLSHTKTSSHDMKPIQNSNTVAFRKSFRINNVITDHRNSNFVEL